MCGPQSPPRRSVSNYLCLIGIHPDNVGRLPTNRRSLYCLEVSEPDRFEELTCLLNLHLNPYLNALAVEVLEKDGSLVLNIGLTRDKVRPSLLLS